jgi:hypothetical protein
MRNRPKAAVLAVYPSANCRIWDGVWCVFTDSGQLCIGFGKTAFAAWHNAQKNMKGAGK